MPSQAAVWGPPFGGDVGAAMLTGIFLGQGYAYIRWFPKERQSLRIAVLCIIFVGVFQTAMTLAVAWITLISCRRSASYECIVAIAWQALVGIFTGSLITFGVQMVWIVSGNNRIITGLVATFAATQLILGAICVVVVAVNGRSEVLFRNPYLPASYGASAICDIIISGSMIFYLREARTGVRRSGNRLQRMIVIFVQMGLLTCFTATWVAISSLIRGLNWEALPVGILPAVYVISMLAVLNARKTVQEHKHEDLGPGPEIIVPTLRMDT